MPKKFRASLALLARFQIIWDHESIIDLRYYQIGPGAHFSNLKTVISPSSFDLRSSNFYHSYYVILDAFYQNYSENEFAVSEKTRWRLKTSKNHLAQKSFSNLHQIWHDYAACGPTSYGRNRKSIGPEMDFWRIFKCRSEKVVLAKRAELPWANRKWYQHADFTFGN